MPHAMGDCKFACPHPGAQRSAEEAAASALEALTAAQASERGALSDAEASREDAQR